MATKAKSDSTSEISKQPAKEGAPRWTYVVGAIVGIAGLAWGIVSYFIPRTEIPKTSPVTTPGEVHVSGSGNVGIGTMSGGQVAIGTPAAAPAVAASAKTSGPP